MDDEQLSTLEKLLKEEREKKRQQQQVKAGPPPQNDPPSGAAGSPDQVQVPSLEALSKVLESLNPRDVEVAADTFNPSALFEDKSQAEWFGNIVSNTESEAIKAMHAAAAKIPRWVWILVLAVGAMMGFIAALWLMGGLSGHTVGTVVTSTKTSVSISIPPPPSFNSTSTG
jgi:hypothetical protein